MMSTIGPRALKRARAAALKKVIFCFRFHFCRLEFSFYMKGNVEFEAIEKSFRGKPARVEAFETSRASRKERAATTSHFHSSTYQQSISSFEK